MNQGKIKILVKGCNITQRTANPEGQKKTATLLLAVFLCISLTD